MQEGQEDEREYIAIMEARARSAMISKELRS